MRAACNKRTTAPVRVNSTTAAGRHSRAPVSEQAAAQAATQVNRVVVDELSTSDSITATQTDVRPSAKSADIPAVYGGVSRTMTDSSVETVSDSDGHENDDDVNVENIVIV